LHKTGPRTATLAFTSGSVPRRSASQAVGVVLAPTRNPKEQ